ncbi:TetR/AcrR family transcriptional regulator [Candidatus Leptofilum sp.]|uniref:TetR/AcrR family transcriptional regulator n=1 Tax=Candidatus Leptofilum sp. TaxID=3241576 RepID=UPI003B5C5693
MQKKKEDRRVKYTKMVLKNSLLELLREKPVQKITVTEICRKADINRNTFYAHYHSPENLLSQIENELFDQLTVAIGSEMDSEKLLLKICQVVYANQELSKIIFSEHGNQELLERIQLIGRANFVREWQPLAEPYSPDALKKIYSFVSNGTVGIMQEWIRNDFRESPEEIAAFTAGIIEHLQQAIRY